LVTAFDGGDDFVRAGGPGEGFRVGVVLGEEAVDGGLEVDDRSEDAAGPSPIRRSICLRACHRLVRARIPRNPPRDSHVRFHPLAALGHFYFVPFVRNAYLFVDLFFVLSGFVITHAYSDRIDDGRSFARFVVRRFGRVWPLHISILAVFIIVEIMKLVAVSSLGVLGRYAPFTGPAAVSSILTNALLIHSFGLDGKLTWNHPS